MINYISAILISQYSIDLLSLNKVGEGFYGYIYLARVQAGSFIVKVFKQSNMMNQEIMSLDLMRQVVKTPIIYDTIRQNEHISYDILLMEYITGMDASKLELDKDSNLKIGENIIENILALHNLHNDKYGYIQSATYNSWSTFYNHLSNKMLHNIEKLVMDKLMRKSSFDKLIKAYSNFDQIFCEDAVEASLIHGDLNTQNIMINPTNYQVTSIIDPINSMWGDREIELFQLDENNGKKYRLLDIYRSSTTLSTNFDYKNAYYACFAEFNHYANVKIGEDTNTEIMLEKLTKYV